MDITWIIVLSLIGFILLILMSKVFFSFLKKEKKTMTEEKEQKLSFEYNFMRLEAILNSQQQLQKTEKNDISKLNAYLKKELLLLTKDPLYIFNLHLLEMEENLDQLICQKLLVNSASTWKKKFSQEITLLQFKNQEFEKKNNELKNFKLAQEKEIFKKWNETK